MTAPCLQVLFEARAQGLAVDDAVVARALAALERCRTPEGNFAYSASSQTREPERSMPGATGRMVSGEMVLLLAGRGTPERVASAIDAFVAYWQELERRRAKTGTHVPPYGVAPYYFQYAHWYAAQAAELLEGARRVATRGHVLPSSTHRAEIAAWQQAIDTVSEFLNDPAELHSTGPGTASVVQPKALYARYREWCGEAGHRCPLGRTKFWQRFDEAAPPLGFSRESRDKSYHLVGLELGPAPVEPEL